MALSSAERAHFPRTTKSWPSSKPIWISAAPRSTIAAGSRPPTSVRWNRLEEEAGHLSDRLAADEANVKAQRALAALNHPAAPDRGLTVNTRIAARGHAMRNGIA